MTRALSGLDIIDQTCVSVQYLISDLNIEQVHLGMLKYKLPCGSGSLIYPLVAMSANSHLPKSVGFIVSRLWNMVTSGYWHFLKLMVFWSFCQLSEVHQIHFCWEGAPIGGVLRFTGNGFLMSTCHNLQLPRQRASEGLSDLIHGEDPPWSVARTS